MLSTILYIILGLAIGFIAGKLDDWVDLDNPVDPNNRKTYL